MSGAFENYRCKNCFRFIDVQTEVQRGKVTRQRPPSSSSLQPRLDPQQSEGTPVLSPTAGCHSGGLSSLRRIPPVTESLRVAVVLFVETEVS